MDFKTKELSRKAIEHLLIIGCKTDCEIEKLKDAPYLLINKGIIKTCFSVKEYRDFGYSEKQENKILKLQKELPLKQKKELTHKEKAAYKLVKLLNNTKNSKITGYDVSWTLQPQERDVTKLEILPITNTACGSISMEHLEVILNFAKEHNYVYPSIGYTDWNNEKKRYGTYTPCVTLW